MRSHALARKLLELPDVMVVTLETEDDTYYQVTSVEPLFLIARGKECYAKPYKHETPDIQVIALE